ncbi:molybdate ABC transporter substrate-binding protein [Amycolatopsis regifaucium]|uniref:Molybdate ABC transporter substrate-binding protein n=1 Tax=Amycolatopsis regifaucium TaxID=546365 RepID=A0A154MTL4_9PSEU|nr:molybdate ABC transporter substrate-binding protein [Amycolatopsis regifaucium]KZB87253.1 molybdate-binding protein [Amycolatopsis regifaucium]OKA08085.1 molybdate ABC transporter substrate-binding protein [Amycolatopsis regifaucium]SFI39011.1 molybdate transport system substrate-binding protein [Amycolatopsis regifaucium]
MRRLVPALLALALAATACGSERPVTATIESRTLTVFAAASLTESFGTLGKRFEERNSGVTVKFSFEGSSALVQKLTQGAKADIFASADQANMDKAAKGEVLDGQPSVFATNRLAIVVGKGNPKGIKGLADLAKDGLTVVVCAPQVPCGAAAKKVQQTSGVTLKPASEEQDVKSVLAKVRSGDADAGLVYVTDATSAAKQVDKVDFPESAGAVNSYPIAVVKDAPQADLARRFREFVLSAEGKQELAKAGFGAP